MRLMSRGSATAGTGDRAMILIVGGALLLIVLGLISIPFAARREPTLAPATTPEGVVQRFYQSVYAGDYQSAYDLLSEDTRARVSLLELQQQLSSELDNSQLRVGAVTDHGTTATVAVTLTYVQPGGIFGSGEWTRELEVLLRRDGDSWHIVSGPFYVAPRA